MGKLNIAHHKSYHPYRRDNIEKVRRDEEEARLKEANEEGRMMLADSEARLDLLRQRAGLSDKPKKKKLRADDDMKVLEAGPSHTSLSSGGHINFFEDLEQNAITTAVRASREGKPMTAETEKGFALAPSAKDLKPWYVERTAERNGDTPVTEDLERRMKRDMARKSKHDPLFSITQQLASRSPSTSTSKRPFRTPALPASSTDPQLDSRLLRESSERQRALALIQRKRREMTASATPSTVRGDDADSEYGDMYNKRDVIAAHRRWDDDSDHRTRRRGPERYW